MSMKSCVLISVSFNYSVIGALVLWTVPVVDSSFIPEFDVFIDNVLCRSDEAELLKCSHVERGDPGFRCSYGGNAGVKCREEELRVKNVSVDTTTHAILISWDLYSGELQPEPSSLRVWCFNQQRVEFSLWLNNETLAEMTLGNIFISAPFACCILTIYYGYYETERRCNSTNSLSDLFTSPAPNLTVTLKLFNESFTAPISTHVNLSTMPASVESKNIVQK